MRMFVVQLRTSSMLHEISILIAFAWISADYGAGATSIFRQTGKFSFNERTTRSETTQSRIIR